MQSFLDDYHKITVEIPKTDELQLPSFMLWDGYIFTPLNIKKIEFIDNIVRYKLDLVINIDFLKKYYVYSENGENSILVYRAILQTKRFDKLNYYPGKLGSFYTKESTKFFVWAPIAYNVCVELYNFDKAKEIHTYNLDRYRRGLWYIEIEGDLECFSYNFIVSVNDTINRTYDPYAISTALNRSASFIIDREKILKPKKFKNNVKTTEAIIYEASVRDFSSDKNQVFLNSSYLTRFIESDVKNTEGDEIGFDYLVDLGITHVQLLPLTDYGSVDDHAIFEKYNWGYDTMQHTAMKPLYATDILDPYNQIKEVQQLVHYAHQKNIGVILDVVYNHVYRREKFALELLTPGYVYRYNNFEYSNGSGCGNDIATERIMNRKYIIDSLKNLYDIYHFDGFRFDLMGLMDIETMKAISEYFFKKNVYIYGEGWNLDTNLEHHHRAILANASMIKNIGFFSPFFRDKVKGDSFNMNSHGICSLNHDEYGNIKNVMLGIREDYPVELTQIVNYVSCHDNHTLYDFLRLRENNDMVYNNVKNALNILLLSQGTVFIHAGCEFMRTKAMIDNSYNSDDSINHIHWDNISLYGPLVKHVKNLIKIRRNLKPLTLSSIADVNRKCKVIVDGDCIHYKIEDKKQYSLYNEIYIIINLSNQKLYLEKDFHEYKALLINDSCDILEGYVLDKVVIIEAASALVMCK